MAVTAKLNMADGVPGGLWLDESIEVARMLESDGYLDALELTGGSSLANPMYLFRGEAPLREFGATLPPALRLGFRLFGHRFLPSYPFEEAFFLPYARQFRDALDHAAHPARRHQPAGHHRARPGRGLRLRGHGPGPAARARPGREDAQGDLDRVAVHPLQQVHAHHLPGNPLRPRPDTGAAAADGAGDGAGGHRPLHPAAARSSSVTNCSSSRRWPCSPGTTRAGSCSSGSSTPASGPPSAAPSNRTSRPSRPPCARPRRKRASGWSLGRILGVVGGPEFRITYPNGDQTSYVSTVFDATVTGGTPDARRRRDVGGAVVGTAVSFPTTR